MKRKNLLMPLLLISCMVLNACSASGTGPAANEAGGEKETVEVWV